MKSRTLSIPDLIKPIHHLSFEDLHELSLYDSTVRAFVVDAQQNPGSGTFAQMLIKLVWTLAQEKKVSSRSIVDLISRSPVPLHQKSDGEIVDSRLSSNQLGREIFFFDRTTHGPAVISTSERDIQIGDQIVFYPDDNSYPEFGFIVSWDGVNPIVGCRFWALDALGKRLRTVANAESIDVAYLRQHDSVHPDRITEVMSRL